MKAETAYNVAMSLPPGELERLLTMLQKESKPLEAKPKKKKQNEEEMVWSREEYYEMVYKLLMDRKKRKTAPSDHLKPTNKKAVRNHPDGYHLKPTMR